MHSLFFFICQSLPILLHFSITPYSSSLLIHSLLLFNSQPRPPHLYFFFTPCSSSSHHQSHFVLAAEALLKSSSATENQDTKMFARSALSSISNLVWVLMIFSGVIIVKQLATHTVQHQPHASNLTNTNLLSLQNLLQSAFDLPMLLGNYQTARSWSGCKKSPQRSQWW